VSHFAPSRPDNLEEAERGSVVLDVDIKGERTHVWQCGACCLSLLEIMAKRRTVGSAQALR
jgi:hypothetical protein